MAWNDNPVCPYCEAELVDWWDGHGLLKNSDEANLTCNNCNKDFHVTMCVSASFMSEKTKNGGGD